VDEVYQDQLALLLAVEPSNEGDRLVGFQLVHGSVDAKDVQAFLARLKQRGIEPDQVVTDGSPLYPQVLAKLWPEAAHQLCLFHETRYVTKAVMQVIRAVQQQIPAPPPDPSPTLRGRLRHQHHPTDRHPRDRDVCIARVLALQGEGHSLKAIARMTGHSRNTVKSWLRGTVQMPRSLPELSGSWQEGTARPPPPTEPGAPPAGWSSWAQVQSFREALQTHRFALARRSRRQTAEQREVLSHLFATPLGPLLKTAHQFAQSWYKLFREEGGRRRTVEQAWERYEALRTSKEAQALPALRRLQDKMSRAHFDKLSAFLHHEDRQATNNAAERMGRAFRHLQAPHYNLRTEHAIEGALKARALRSTRPPSPAARSSRGRKPQSRSSAEAA
jgi:predicted transcriptional regulator